MRCRHAGERGGRCRGLQRWPCGKNLESLAVDHRHAVPVTVGRRLERVERLAEVADGKPKGGEVIPGVVVRRQHGAGGSLPWARFRATHGLMKRDGLGSDLAEASYVSAGEARAGVGCEGNLDITNSNGAHLVDELTCILHAYVTSMMYSAQDFG